jgi:hypothetical protein
MKLLAAATLVLLLVVSGTAQGQAPKLTKADARLAANLAGYDFVSHRDYLTSSQIGACRRQSPTRFTCEGQATGDDFTGCESTEPYACHFTFHTCEFDVAVHRAGYSALGRVRGATCTARDHT